MLTHILHASDLRIKESNYSLMNSNGTHKLRVTLLLQAPDGLQIHVWPLD